MIAPATWRRLPLLDDVPGRAAGVGARMDAVGNAVRDRVARQAAEGLPLDRVATCGALDYLRALPAGCVDLCVTSPPYWAKREYRGDPGELGLEASPEAYLANLRAILREVQRVTVPTGWLVLNLGDTYASQPGRYRGDPRRQRGISGAAMAAAGGARAGRELDVPDKSLSLVPWRLLAALVLEDGWRARNVVAWVKPGHQPENVFDRLTQAWEPVLLLSRGPRPWFEREAVDGRPVDVWSIPVGRRGRGNGHPAVFPDQLAERAIARMCPWGGVVLDPFAGSGTVAAVAARMGRRSLGCDLYDWQGGEP